MFSPLPLVIFSFSFWYLKTFFKLHSSFFSYFCFSLQWLLFPMNNFSSVSSQIVWILFSDTGYSGQQSCYCQSSSSWEKQIMVSKWCAFHFHSDPGLFAKPPCLGSHSLAVGWWRNRHQRRACLCRAVQQCWLVEENCSHVLLGLSFFVVLILVFFAVLLPFEIWLRCIWCIVTARTKFTLWMQQTYKFLYSDRSKPSPIGCQTSKNFDLTGLPLIYADSLKGRNPLTFSFLFF